MRSLILALALITTCCAVPRHSHDQIADDDGVGVLHIWRPRPVIFINPLDDPPVLRHRPSFFHDDSFSPFISRFPNPFKIFQDLWNDLPLPSNNNTQIVNATSETKVINGHKVIVNDTTYKNPDSDTILRVQVIATDDTTEEAKRSSNVEDVTVSASVSASMSTSMTTPMPERSSAENEKLQSAVIRKRRSAYYNNYYQNHYQQYQQPQNDKRNQLPANNNDNWNYNSQMTNNNYQQYQQPIQNQDKWIVDGPRTPNQQSSRQANWQPFYWGPQKNVMQQLRMDINEPNLANDLNVNNIKASRYAGQYYGLPPDVELFDTRIYNNPNKPNA